MSKRYNKLLCVLWIVLLSVSCGKDQPSDSAAEAIIQDFWQGDYEYTRTSLHKIEENPEVVDEAAEGKLIADPYQQYEQITGGSETQGIVEQYWHMRDGKVEHYIKISIGENPDRWMSFESDVKGSALYVKENLTFAFEGEESISGRDVYVYRTQYEEELTVDYSQLPEEEQNGLTEIVVPYTAAMEYYIDFSAKEVVRIRIDGTGGAKASATANLMLSGMPREEAEKEIRENGIEESYEIRIDIKNYNGEIEIDVPEDLNN